LITDVLGRVSSGENLSLEEMTGVVDAIMRGEWSESQILLLLNALRLKEETVDEIAGAALAMRRHMTPVKTRRTGILDTCGTGGIGSRIFNVSTAAAIAAAASGAVVAKHGNRSVTSKSGSADVLAQLGVNVEAPVAIVERCLDELGLCFCFAQQFHPAMRHVASARKKLGVRTIFNLLGPLCNPASAEFQLLGVGTRSLAEKIAGAMQRLEPTRAVIITGDDGLGELTLSTSTQVIIVERGTRRETTWHPSDFGLPTSPLDSLEIEGPAASAELIRQIFAGRTGAARDIVVLNAAASIWTAGLAGSLVECAQRVREAIDRGDVQRLLGRLVEVSRQ
jgi:anthranilate phosphoribosyltransferase